MALRPLNDNLIIIPSKEEYVDDNPEIIRILNEGKITIPEKFQGLLKKSPMSGEIVSWGSRCHYSYKVGEKIKFSRYSGAPITIEKKKYRVINEKDVLAKEE